MGKESFVATLSDGGKAINGIGVARDNPRRAANKALYEAYSQDPNYKDVVFDEKTGGVMATHVGHNIEHNEKDTARYFGGMTKEDLERECQLEVVRMGGSAIFRDESERRADKTVKTALDAVINGSLTDIRSVTSNGENYRNQLEDKNKQLLRWNRENPTNKAHSIALYFHDPTMYSAQKVRDGIRDLRKTIRNGHRVHLNFYKVLVIVRGDERIRTIRV